MAMGVAMRAVVQQTKEEMPWLAKVQAVSHYKAGWSSSSSKEGSVSASCRCACGVSLSPVVSTRLCQMYCTLRAHFAATIVSSCVFDISRLGGRIRMLGYIGRPGGYGGWLLPRAAGLT